MNCTFRSLLSLSPSMRTKRERIQKLALVAENTLQSALLLAFRISWGWQFFVSGKGKLFNHNDVADFFASINIPLPGANAWFIGGLECFGGLLLLIGLLSRPIAFLLSIAMTVAYLAVTDDRAKLFSIFQDPAPFLSADPFFFLLTAVLVLAFGPGSISVDSIAAKWLSNRSSAKAAPCRPPGQQVIAQT